jgi:hypothetical protein
MVPEAAPITRTGVVKILDGRHPEPITFDRDNCAELKAQIEGLRAQGFVVAVEGEIQSPNYQLPSDLAEDIIVLAPLVGG